MENITIFMPLYPVVGLNNEKQLDILILCVYNTSWEEKKHLK